MSKFADEAENVAFFEAYNSESDLVRAVGLVSILEDRIDSIFRIFLVDDKAIRNDLFLPDRPLGNLGAKLRLLYMLRMLRRGEYKDILIFIRIRNKFAHEPRIQSLEEQPVSCLLRNLTTWETFKNISDSEEDVLGIFEDSLTSDREMFKLAVRIYINKLEWIAKTIAENDSLRPSVTNFLCAP